MDMTQLLNEMTKILNNEVIMNLSNEICIYVFR